MQKKIISFITVLVCLQLHSQVGINTDNPQSTLDVNGDITFKNELKVGGTVTTEGNQGTYNQILVSQGTGSAPEWKTSKVQFFETGQYRTTATFVETDKTGIDFGHESDDNIVTSELGESLSDDSLSWIQIPGLESTFTINNENNRINFVFQTGVEMSDVGDNSNRFIRYICGIFIDDELAAMRADQINGVRNKGQKNQAIYTLNYTVNDLEIGDYTAKVACRRIASSNTAHYLSIGRTTTDGTQVVNNFMLQSAFKIDVNELVIITQ